MLKFLFYRVFSDGWWNVAVFPSGTRVRGSIDDDDDGSMVTMLLAQNKYRERER